MNVPKSLGEGWVPVSSSTGRHRFLRVAREQRHGRWYDVEFHIALEPGPKGTAKVTEREVVVWPCLMLASTTRCFTPAAHLTLVHAFGTPADYVARWSA
jgi:hypothetical protein